MIQEYAGTVVLSYTENYELRWLLVNGTASTGGGVPRGWFGLSVGGFPVRERVGEMPTRFFLSQCRDTCDVFRLLNIRFIILIINHGGSQ